MLQVRAEWKPIVASLGGLFQACGAAAGQPGRKREMDDNSKRLAALFWHLNKGDVSEAVAAALHQLCAVLDEGNYAHAAHIQVCRNALGVRSLGCAPRWMRAAMCTLPTSRCTAMP